MTGERYVEILRWPAINPGFRLHNPGLWSALRLRVDTDRDEYVLEGLEYSNVDRSGAPKPGWDPPDIGSAGRTVGKQGAKMLEHAATMLEHARASGRAVEGPPSPSPADVSPTPIALMGEHGDGRLPNEYFAGDGPSKLLRYYWCGRCLTLHWEDERVQYDEHITHQSTDGIQYGHRPHLGLVR